MKARIVIDADPVPKGRPRASLLPSATGVVGKHLGQGSSPATIVKSLRGMVNVYTPKRTREWERQVADAARDQLDGVDFGDNPVRVSMTLFVKRRADLDNLAKSILDGLNGVAWNDDTQVVELLVRRRLAQRGRVMVDIERLDWQPWHG